jgi:hypothetical protein
MRKLYDLVKFRNDLESKINDLNLTVNIQDVMLILNTLKESNKHDIYTSPIDNFINDYKWLSQESENILDKLRDKIIELNHNIDTIAGELFDNDEYKRLMSEDRINQILPLTKTLEGVVSSKISFHSDWHYPTLHINPRDKKWIDYMVSGDPLYLTSHDDTYFNQLKEMVSSYPALYQQRLRLYQIENRDFSVLPQGQFGFVTSWDNFNYLSFDKVEQYLRQIFNLLRPGGVLFFNYTNCDLETMSFNAESWAAGYTTARSLKKLAVSIGYELGDFSDLETEDAFTTHMSLAELRKPGILKTVKSHQSMAQILTK